MNQLNKRVDKLEAIHGEHSDAVNNIMRVGIDNSEDGACYTGSFHVIAFNPGPRKTLRVEREDMAGVLLSAISDDQRQRLAGEVIEEAQLRWAAA